MPKSMTMKLGHKLTILTLAMLIVPCLVSAAIRVEHYAKKDGLAGTVVSDILHDSRGYMWIGTWEGLSRFDGKEFVNYSEGDATSIPYLHNRVMRVYEDGLGNVWVMMYDDRLFRLNRRTDTFDRMAEVFPDFQNVRMYNPLFTARGDVWAEVRGTGAIHFIADSATNALSAEMVPLVGQAINFLHEDSRGTVWAATDKRLSVLRSDSLHFNTLADHHDIRAVAETGSKVIWGTADGSIIEYDYKTGRNKIIPLLHNVPVTALSVSPDGKTLYIATSRSGLYRYDMPDGHLSQIFATPASVDRLFTDSHGLLWIISRQPGVMKYDPVTRELASFAQAVTPSSYEPTPDIVECNGDVWVAMTGGGFGRYDRSTGRLDYFHNDPEKPGDMSNVVLQFDVSSPDVVWLSTHQRGLDRVTSVDNKVSHTWIKDRPQSLVDNEVKSFFLDTDTTLLIGTKAGELYRYTISARLLSTLTTDSRGEPIGRVYSICRDGDGDIWLGTRGNGLLRMTSDASGMHIASRYAHDPADKYSISSDEIQSIVTDRMGRMWIGTYGGGVNIAVRDGSSGIMRFISPANTMKGYPLASCGKVRSLAAQSDGTVWAGTTEGLVALVYDEASKDVKARVCRKDGDNPESLSTDDIVTVFVDSRDVLWVGTMTGGLNRYEGMEAGKPRFTVFSTANGLPSNHIKSITEDRDGNLWIATDENIVMFNNETQAFSVYLEDADSANTIFSENAVAVLPDGDPLFGANNGCYRVDNLRMSSEASGRLSLVMTSVSIDGMDTSPRVNPEMSEYVPESGVVTLRSRKSTLTIKVMSLNYSLQSRVRYSYKIEGRGEDKWINCGTENTITLSDLPSGCNTLVIRAMLSDDPSKWEECRLHIVVPSAWWATWWFWLIVVALTAGGVMLFRYVRTRRAEPAAADDSQQQGAARRTFVMEPGKIALDDDEDEKFVNNLLAWMEENYSNPDMKIDNMVTSSGLGRTSFYNKLKTLANTSPVEFVIDFRMKKAKMFIENTNKTIAEIAYLTGYIDPHYFTRAFKTRYGETPTQYRKRYNASAADKSADSADKQ